MEKTFQKIFFILFFSVSLFYPSFSFLALAQEPVTNEKSKTLEIKIPLEVKIPGLNQTDVTKITPGEYVRNLFIFGFSFIGFLAVAVIIYGGILYAIPGQISKGKSYIQGAIIGIIILFSSYLILYIINPDLTNLKMGDLKEVNIPEPKTPGNSSDEFFNTDPNVYIRAGASSETGQAIYGKGQKIAADLQSPQFARITSILKSSSLDSSIIVTETNGSHGCISGDSCVSGASCGKSAHCQNRAVDINIWTLTKDQIEQLTKDLSGDPCVDDLFYNGFPQYCRNEGKAYTGKACSDHDDHIHFSIKSSCK